MALHFNCPFCGHSQHYESAPAGGFTACPECDETLPESYQASPAGEGPAASEAVAGGGEAPVDAEFLHEPPTPEVMPTIAGGEASLPHPRRKPSYTWVWLLIGALVVLPIGACMLMLPALNASREAARRNGCLNKMRIIALALQQYEYEHGRLPPAYIADADGKPMHSWRVLILPYLEERGLYEQYDFSQPWDSENNLRVAEQIPWFYQCPSDADLSQYNHTSYMVIVGDDTFFPGSESRSMADCRDYPDSTLVVVEVADSGNGLDRTGRSPRHRNELADQRQCPAFDRQRTLRQRRYGDVRRWNGRLLALRHFAGRCRSVLDHRRGRASPAASLGLLVVAFSRGKQFNSPIQAIASPAERTGLRRK